DVSKKARDEANAAALKLDIANKNEFLKQQTLEAKNSQELLRIQISMAGSSDTQLQKALELKKLDQEILAIKLKYPNATEAELEALRKVKQETVGLEEQAKRTQNTFQNGFSHAFQNFKEKASDSFAQGEQAFSSMADSMSSALDTFVETGKISFRSLILDMIKNLIKLQMQAQLSGIFKFLGSALGIGGGNSAGLTSTAPKSGGLAMSWSAGGNELGGGQPSMVGENGPELFVPKSAGTIVPNNRVNSLMGNQPQVVYNGTVIQNMSAIDTQSAAQFIASNKQAIWAANQSAQRGLPQTRR
ncbi:MAG: phage tail tape measure C-terminal domain-containing protein, partial [Bacteroidota bacterium]